jgi:CheY-like chemotaxis protein
MMILPRAASAQRRLPSESPVDSTVATVLLVSVGNGETLDEIAERRRHSDLHARKPFVLVADDEVIIRETLVEILRLEGYDAFGVQDGVEAVDCAVKMSPDIFLADVSMPRMNGIEAAKQIKERVPKTRVICVSGHAATSDLLLKAREDGHDFEFLPKPLRPDTLISTIRGHHV